MRYAPLHTDHQNYSAQEDQKVPCGSVEVVVAEGGTEQLLPVLLLESLAGRPCILEAAFFPPAIQTMLVWVMIGVSLCRTAISLGAVKMCCIGYTVARR